MTSMTSINEFLQQNTLAIAGVSRKGNKFGNTVLKELTKKGYRMSVIHPHAAEIDGFTCYSSLSELPDSVEGIVLVTPPEQTKKIIEEVSSGTIRHIWMQQGAESEEAIEVCHQKGINVVFGECILMFAEPRSIHKFHRWLRGLLGKLPKE